MKKIILATSLLISLLSLTAQEKDLSDSIVFTRTEVEAQFPGGTPAWVIYLRKNLKGNTPINNGAPAGAFTVIVRFIVDKTGKISNVVAETNSGFGMEQEVIRIIKQGPDWIPASQNGRMVNAYRRQPVKFVVGEEGVDISSAAFLTIGKENTVFVSGKKLDDKEIEFSVNNGTVARKGDGKYILTPVENKMVILELFEVKKGKRKKITAAGFPVMSTKQIESIPIK